MIKEKGKYKGMHLPPVFDSISKKPCNLRHKRTTGLFDISNPESIFFPAESWQSANSRYTMIKASYLLNFPMFVRTVFFRLVASGKATPFGGGRER